MQRRRASGQIDNARDDVDALQDKDKLRTDIQHLQDSNTVQDVHALQVDSIEAGNINIKGKADSKEENQR